MSYLAICYQYYHYSPSSFQTFVNWLSYVWCNDRVGGRFFMVSGREGGCWVKMSATMVHRPRKIKKKYWLKRPKVVPKKTKFGPTYKWLKISHLEFFFWRYYFGHATFLYLSTRSGGHHQIFFNSTFSNRKSQSKQLLAKKVTHFTIPFRSKILTHFTRRNSLDIEKKCYRNAAKTLFDFIYFPANMVPFGARNNICTAPFLDPQELHSWSTLKANFCIFLRKKTFVSNT